MRAIACTLGLVFALALTACGGADKPTATTAADEPVRIGSKNFTESKILGELYKQALEAKGINVELRSNVGSTELVNRALRNDLLDMYPEYVGVLLSEVDGILDRPANADAAYTLAKGVEERRHLTLLDQTTFSNENALVVTKRFSRSHHVRAIPDLARLRRPNILAAPEFKDRFEGVIGLGRVYGLRSVKVTSWGTAGEQYPALDAGKTDIAVAYTTDSQLASGRYSLLDDPKGLFAEQHLAPVISQKVLRAHGPKLASAINAVSALLTTKVMRELNAKVDTAKRMPRDVAAEFLRDHELA
ncbi:MAG: osmoprotectant transport system substrate-binding protein [Solirubrobacteraceae bacterium]|nr:osmoprotectant transport system substrate-binding protein [Solirubrobacteraceae bacterium]